MTHLSDRSQWKLRGPVRSMRSEIAERDDARSDWKPAKLSKLVLFDERGRVLHVDVPGGDGAVHRTSYTYGADGRLQKVEYGIAGGPPELTHVYSYDSEGRPAGILQVDADGGERTTDTWRYTDDGRTTHIQFLQPAPHPNFAVFVEGGEFGYGAEGAARLTTHFDARGRIVEALFHDDKNVLLRRIARTYDQDGRLQVEEAQMLEGVDLTSFPDMTAEDREKMQSLVAVTFGATRVEYHYDAAGRVASRTQRMGMLAEDHVTYAYDDQGNVVEESERSVSREMGLGEGDTLETGEEKTRAVQRRFAYAYDRHGNWTERVASWRNDEKEDYRPSGVERRVYEYSS